MGMDTTVRILMNALRKLMNVPKMLSVPILYLVTTVPVTQATQVMGSIAQMLMSVPKALMTVISRLPVSTLKVRSLVNVKTVTMIMLAKLDGHSNLTCVIKFSRDLLISLQRRLTVKVKADGLLILRHNNMMNGWFLLLMEPLLGLVMNKYKKIRNGDGTTTWE